MKATKPNLLKLNTCKRNALKFGKHFLLLTTTIFLITGFLSTSFLITSAMAKTMTKDQYQFLEKNLEFEYTSAKDKCDVLKDNANDICSVQANTKRSVSKAILKASFEPTLENQVNARIAIAEADYAVAVEICDEAKDKSVCINQANVIKDQAIADARAVNKTSQLNPSLQLDKYKNRILVNKTLANKVLVRLSPQVDKNIHIKTLVKNPQKRITA